MERRQQLEETFVGREEWGVRRPRANSMGIGGSRGYIFCSIKMRKIQWNWLLSGFHPSLSYDNCFHSSIAVAWEARCHK